MVQMTSVTLTKVGLEGVKFNAPVGFFAEERLLKNNFLVDVFVSFNSSEIGDELSNTINYVSLYQICEENFRQEHQLIETVAQQILNQIKKQFPDLKQIYIKIKKLNPPIKAEIQHSFVVLEYIK
jgi:dihydroneopterin aldolase